MFRVSVMRRPVLIAAGTLCLGLGIIGVFVPVLPTTPFLLLASYCYARSSTRLHQWLLANRLFGRHIRDWEEHRSLPLKAKMLISLLLASVFALTVSFAIPYLALKILLILLGIGVTIYIWRIPTRS